MAISFEAISNILEGLDMDKAIRAITPVRDDKVLEKKWNGKRVVRDAYNTYVDPGLDCTGDPGMTDQSQAADCDVNKIVDRYMKTGVLPGTDVEGLYGDFVDVTDFQTSMNIVIRAQEQFDALDAKVRKRFGNDPSEFLAFCNDPSNAKELVSLGLGTLRPKEPDSPFLGDSSSSPTLPPKGPDLGAGSPDPKPRPPRINT